MTVYTGGKLVAENVIPKLFVPFEIFLKIEKVPRVIVFGRRALRPDLGGKLGNGQLPIKIQQRAFRRSVYIVFSHARFLYLSVGADFPKPGRKIMP